MGWYIVVRESKRKESRQVSKWWEVDENDEYVTPNPNVHRGPKKLPPSNTKTKNKRKNSTDEKSLLHPHLCRDGIAELCSQRRKDITYIKTLDT